MSQRTLEIYVSHERDVKCPREVPMKLWLNHKQIIAGDQVGGVNRIFVSRKIAEAADIHPIQCAGCPFPGCYISFKTFGVNEDALASFNSASIEPLPADYQPRQVTFKSRIHI